MSVLATQPERKILAIRTTNEERTILLRAAKSEQRSLSVFMLRSALDAAQSAATGFNRDRSARTPESIEAALNRAQEIMLKYRNPGHSFVDEFLAEKRADAARERY